MLRGAIACFALMAVMPLVCAHDHPSDEELISRFERQRAGFEALRGMILGETDVVRVGTLHYTTRTARFRKPTETLTVERWVTYLERFGELGLESGIQRSWETDTAAVSVFFLVSSEGILDSGSSKGIAYLPEKPKYIFNSLNYARQNDIRYGNRHIEGNWYVFFN